MIKTMFQTLKNIICVDKFINDMMNERKYCRRVIGREFDILLVMAKTIRILKILLNDGFCKK